jgi:hypothetical protein
MPHFWNGQELYIPIPTPLMKVFTFAGFEPNESLVPIRKFRWDGDYDKVGRLIYHEVAE